MIRVAEEDLIRVAISAKVVADMLTVVGVNRVLTVDLHADQIQGFFDIPVDNIYGSPVLVDDIEDQRFEPRPLVSPLSSPTSAMPARIAVRVPPAWPSAPR